MGPVSTTAPRGFEPINPDAVSRLHEMLETFLSSPDAEMEARYTGAPHAVVDIGTFKRVCNKLTSRVSVKLTHTASETLDLVLDGVRVSLAADGGDGGDGGNISDINPREAIRKTALAPSIDLSDYSCRVNLKNEAPASAPASMSLHTAQSARYKVRHSYAFLEKNVVVDATWVFTVTRFPAPTAAAPASASASAAAPAAAPETRLTTMRDVKRYMTHHGSQTFEFEVEFAKDKKAAISQDKRAAVLSMYDTFMVMRGLIEDTGHMSVSEYKRVTNEYVVMTTAASTPAEQHRQTKFARYNSAGGFIGPKPVTLELDRHLARDSAVHLTTNGDYTATKKVDGERHLLYVCTRGGVYIINDRMRIHKIGSGADKSITSSLLDAEVVQLKKGGGMRGGGGGGRKKRPKTDAAPMPAASTATSTASTATSTASTATSPYRVYVFDAYFRNDIDIRSRALVGMSGARLSIAADIVSVLRKTYANVAVKDFIVCGSSPIEFANACKTAMADAVEADGVTVSSDGLIMTPISEGVPPRGGTWSSVLKWKPPDQNTVDFAVNFDDETAIDERGFVYGVPQVMDSAWNARGSLTATAHATGALYSPGNYSMLTVRRDAVLVDFTPPGRDRPVKVRARLVDAKHYVIGSDAVIKSGSIVECNWVDGMWNAYRLRPDKPRPNHVTTAVSVWRSIQRPVTREMMTDSAAMEAALDAALDGDGDGDGGGDGDGVYYEAGTTKSMESMRQYHNEVKLALLKRACHHGGCKLFDFGVGRAGDLNKWVTVGVSAVMGIDKSRSNLYDPDKNLGSAYMRVLQMKKKSPDMKLKLLFLPLDASTNFFDEAVIAASIPPADADYDLARAAFGHSKLSPRLEMYNNFAMQKFDVAACMFAVHYMFESEATITRFCDNVERVLSDNGQFVVAHLDGDVVRARLRENDGVYAGKIDGRVVWKIARKYTEGTVANSTGDVVGVYVETIGHAMDEYLVSHKDLCAFLLVHGIEEVESSMFDPASYRPSHSKSAMTPSELNYSSLHRMSMFQKKVK